MHYYDILLSSYEWQGIALVAMLLLLLGIQLFYYLFRFRRVGTYLNKHRRAIHEELPSISLVIPMFSEDYDYVDDTLPLILSQEAVDFEVVIVYVGSDNDFFDDLVRLKTLCPNITITKIQRNERFPISIKTALNVGIKASHHEHIMFSTTDARPASSKWLSLMARGFQRGDVVLGYCSVETDDNKLDSSFIRLSRLTESMMWLSRAIAGHPYRGIRSNMGFTRSLYFSVNGFNRLNLNIGEDDLFLQSIMKDDNVSVILSPRATVIQRCWGRMDGLIDTTRYYGSAVKFYPSDVRNYVGWELASRILFFVLSVVGIIFLPLELKVLILLFIIIRVGFMLNTLSHVAKRVGEKGVIGRYLLYDMVSPLFTLYMRTIMVKRDQRAWR